MKRRKSFLFISAFTLAAGSFIAGCAHPERDAAAYRHILNSNALPATNQLPDGPLTLTQAMALANRNNEQLGKSGEDYAQALINKSRAVSNFLPTVSFQPSYAIADRPPGSYNSLPLAPTDAATFRTNGKAMTTLQAPVEGNMNLFRGFGDVANLQQAKELISQRKYLLLDLQATVLLDVSQIYYQILSSEQSVVVLKSSVQLQEARLEDVTNQFRNGLATRLAVAQSRADLDAARVQLIAAQGDVVNGRAMLAYLIGVHEVPNVLRDDSQEIRSPLFAEVIYEQIALKCRQDYLATHHEVLAAKQNVNVAIAEYYPQVTINVEGFLYRQFYNQASKWDALLQLYLPIFSAGQIEADVRAAWSRLREAALDESNVRRAALRDVQQSYENYVTAINRVRELRDEVAAAQDAYEQSRQAFANQLAINLDVLTAQDQLLSSQLQLSSATFDQTVYYLDLVRSTGRLVADVPFLQPNTRTSSNSLTAAY
ncbi:MAG TPA: TolC family protein [Tepidisphaeraceae bacterium]|jgi:outer membrane protein